MYIYIRASLHHTFTQKQLLTLPPESSIGKVVLMKLLIWFIKHLFNLI